MLKTLNIENIAVIEKATVDFSNGLNVLTGETGAGKSIVVDSINAILGERTSKELIRHNCESAFVSAYFEDVSLNVKEKLNSFDIQPESDNSLLITRKISSNGKSTCKINGKSVTVSMLKEIGGLLVNIHGQHDSQALLNPDYHYQYIDMLSDNQKIYDDYKSSFRELIAVRRKLKELTANEDEKENSLELLEYQIEELEDANIQVGEREALTKRKELITKSEDLSIVLNNSLTAINGDEDNSGVKNTVETCISSLQTFDEANEINIIFNDINDKFETAKDSINSLLAQLDFDPNELEQIGERLDLLYRLSNKYSPTEQGMIDYLNNAKDKRKSIMFADEELAKYSHRYDECLEIVLDKAQKLSDHRKQIAKKFEQKVKEELEFLDMPKLRFITKFEKGKLSSNGFDKIEFLISTNPGEPPKPLSKIASGGELSRIMLAIKNIIAYNDTVGTLIFDEIDTGVSGRASQKIGYKLKSVSKNTQVICVTHSAQIASTADEHFLISKEYTSSSTYTSVTPLDYNQRKYELARIMGGLKITDSLLQSADEMLKANI